MHAHSLQHIFDDDPLSISHRQVRVPHIMSDAIKAYL